MDKTAIKNFAVWARVKLMEDIRTRLGLLGITEDGISDPMPASTNEVKYFDIGADHPVSIKGKAIHQREQLAEEIRKAGKESNYQSAYRNFIESSAYDWFNRLIAIRYMEVNEYAPLDVRLLSSVEPGKQDPDLVSTPFDGSLEYTESETEQILAWKEQHDNNKLFRFLLFKMCNQLHEVLPGIFEARDDASELLMRQSFIDKDGIIHHLVNDIPEEDWKDQVQIIGWIYQYYNSELKAEVFAKKEKVTKDELPAVTQLFTPDWIVRYMVENSLGRLWIEHLRGLNPDVDEKETAEKFGWKYYLPEAKQEPEVEQQLAKIREKYAALKPEDLSCLDPCMGSGHILVYMFDVLEQIYTSVGYSEREAAKAILENNIYGLDIDDRAYQLAYFAVMMKARQYNRRILTSGIKAHVYPIQESNGITKNQLQEMGEDLSPEEKTKALSQAEKLVELFHDAKEYGSILNIPEMDWDLLRRFATPDITQGQMSLNWNQEASDRMMQLINQGEVMAKKYWVVCTNPPYMSSSNMDGILSKYVKKEFENEKYDLSTVTMKACINGTIESGYIAMINIPVWMFISSFDAFRSELLQNITIVNMVHLGRGVFGSDFGTTSFTLNKMNISQFKAQYLKVFNKTGDVSTLEEKKKRFLDRRELFYARQESFDSIPGRCIAYWARNSVFEAYKNNILFDKIAHPKVGMQTSNNDKYLRLWHEINYSEFLGKSAGLKWIKYLKGGPYRKWYGNLNYVLFYNRNPNYILSQKNARVLDLSFLQKRKCTWTDVTAGENSFRYAPMDTFYDISGHCFFPDAEDQFWLLAYTNSRIFSDLLKMFTSTIHCQVGDVAKVVLPMLTDTEKKELGDLGKECVDISKEDWDELERSWMFNSSPLVRKTSNIAKEYQSYKERINNRFDKLYRNENRINQIIYDAFDVVPEKRTEIKRNTISVRYIVDQSEESEELKGNQYVADKRQAIIEYISYTIGCIFGRYSLDKEGLIYAGGDWKSVQDVYKTFLPDQDNVIPITDQKYLDDDVVERICEFLTVVYGAETLEENLDFIAKALGNKGLISREVIRNYMLNDFFKDHCKTYSVTGSGKRPIYWLFDSGKENAFKALVYMHRWNADTTGRVLIYAQQIQQKYETEIRAIDMMLDHITDARQKSTEEKRQEHLKKQLEELVDYEERLEHMANERIAIDLDDGVKVNYEKVQTDRNGKKYQILAPIK